MPGLGMDTTTPPVPGISMFGAGIVDAWRATDPDAVAATPGVPYRVWLKIGVPEGERSVAGDAGLTGREQRLAAENYDPDWRAVYLLTGYTGMTAGPAHVDGQYHPPLARAIELRWVSIPTAEDPDGGELWAHFEDIAGRLVSALRAKWFTGVSLSMWRRLPDLEPEPGPYLAHVAALAGENPAIAGLSDLSRIQVPDDFAAQLDAAHRAASGSIRTIVYGETTMPDETTPDVTDPEAAGQPGSADESTRAADATADPRTRAVTPTITGIADLTEVNRAMARVAETQRALDALVERQTALVAEAEAREAAATRAALEQDVAALGLRVPVASRGALVDSLAGMSPENRAVTLDALRAVPEPASLQILSGPIEVGDTTVDTDDVVRSMLGTLPASARAQITPDEMQELVKLYAQRSAEGGA